MQNQIEKKQARRKFLSEDKHIEKFVQLVQPLINTNETDSQLHKQQRHALFLNLFYKDKAAPCFIDRDICSNYTLFKIQEQPYETEMQIIFIRQSDKMCMSNSGVGQNIGYLSITTDVEFCERIDNPIFLK